MTVTPIVDDLTAHDGSAGDDPEVAVARRTVGGGIVVTPGRRRTGPRRRGRIHRRRPGERAWLGAPGGLVAPRRLVVVSRATDLALSL
jgi:hypothetical protein